MNISSIFHAWPGMYLAQSFLHSLIAALIVDTALLAWKIEAPVIRQRFRLLVIVLPIISFPLYQFITPDRGSALFRLDAYFDMDRWLELELWGKVPAGVLFLLFLVFTAVVFVLQEMLPIARHTLSSGEGALDGVRPEPESRVTRALEGIPGRRPEVFIIDDEAFAMFSSTGKEPAVYLSGGLVEKLTLEELRAAIAHEIGHIQRSRRPAMVLIFILRVLMFYNPIALMEFRRIIQEEEKICDDVASSITGDRAALAGALRKFYDADNGDPAPPLEDAPRLRDRIEEYSHTLLIEERITRLEESAAPVENTSAVYLVVLMTILAVNYYIV